MVTEIPLRALRNDTSAVLRRVEDGESLTVTVNGRPVAQLVPLQRRRRFIPWDEFRAMVASTGVDARFLDDVRDVLATTTADHEILDPWRKAALRWSDEP